MDKEYQFKLPCWVDIDAESEEEALSMFKKHLHQLDDSLPAPGPFKRVQVDTDVEVEESEIEGIYSYEPADICSSTTEYSVGGGSIEGMLWCGEEGYLNVGERHVSINGDSLEEVEAVVKEKLKDNSLNTGDFEYLTRAFFRVNKNTRIVIDGEEYTKQDVNFITVARED